MSAGPWKTLLRKQHGNFRFVLAPFILWCEDTFQWFFEDILFLCSSMEWSPQKHHRHLKQQYIYNLWQHTSASTILTSFLFPSCPVLCLLLLSKLHDMITYFTMASHLFSFLSSYCIVLCCPCSVRFRIVLVLFRLFLFLSILYITPKLCVWVP